MRDDTRTIDGPAGPAPTLTNVPGLLGHHVAEHLILLQRHRGAPLPGPMLMKDIDDDLDVVALLSRTAELLDPRDGVVLDVLVVSRGWPEAFPAPHEVEEALAPRIDLGAYSGVPAIAAGAPVTDRDGTPRGLVDDPALSPAAGILADAGEAICEDAGALVARFAPESDGERRAAAAEAQDLAERDVARLAARHCAIGEAGAARRLLSWYDEWDALLRDLRDRGAGVDEVLSGVPTLRVLARGLVNLTVRDLTIDVIASADAPLARLLWLECARLFTGRARANALACYALDRWHHGCQGIAEHALAAARDADPGHTLTGLMDRAIAAGRGDEAAATMITASSRLHAAMGEAAYGDGAP
ncbi:DUF4192 domain-containing protein [Corynebacterium sp. 335C]